MGGFEFVEVGDAVLVEVADGGAEDVAGGVVAGVEEAFGDVEVLCYGGRRGEAGGWGFTVGGEGA